MAHWESAWCTTSSGGSCTAARQQCNCWRNNQRLIWIVSLNLILFMAFASCSLAQADPPASASPQPAQPTRTPLPPTATPVPTPQPTLPPVLLGPDEEDFPPGYNPLTGQPVADPSLLELPALLVSISNFPATARPQAGLSFAPLVFQFSITEGADRFLAAFYGAFPFPEVPLTGNCEVRQGAFAQSDTLLGNRVWLDADQDGTQEPGEPGVGGVCVRLYDANGSLLEETSTDSNGYFAFDIQTGGEYALGFEAPPGMSFTVPDSGDDDRDSDADPSSGKTARILIQADTRRWDAGLVLDEPVSPSSAELPKAEVGPVRSGRLLYGHIAGFFQDSCLIYAFASKEVLELIPKCSFVAHQDAGGGSMLEITRMEAIARENWKLDTEFNYASNLFDETPPQGGSPASQVEVYFAVINQSGWQYDPASGTWLRSTDNAEKAAAGQLHPDIDRLNGRQLQFENLVVVMAEHEVVSPTNLNIHLDQGEQERAWLFRDGQGYEIKWSTRSTDYERATGMRRPIRFLNKDGSPAALKPGRTWIVIVTPFSQVTQEAPGVWRVRYYAPAGAAGGS
ncbi:MAG: SdrD B-like domain-containing protein [Chloroflexota bacterium]